MTANSPFQICHCHSALNIILLEQILVSYLSLCVFPWPIDEIDREHLNAQSPLNAIHHNLQAFTVTDWKTCVVQFVRHLFEVKAGILRERWKS